MDTDKHDDIHPISPAGGGGPGASSSAMPLGLNTPMDKWKRPGPLGAKAGEAGVRLSISGVIVAGGELSKGTIVAVNTAAAKTPSQ